MYAVRTKDLVYDSIRKCVAQIESDTKKEVKRLVSDYGSEIVSNKPKEFLMSKSILAQRLSASFTPQQNGLIERDNRTVIEAARAMLYHRILPEELWSEAVHTAVYLLNRTVNKLTGDKTPFELYYGRKPRVNHIKVFGCLAFMKAQEKKRSGYQKKLEPRADKGVLVGYN